ncbi:CPBP family intramembrane metalloprotease [Pseudomonas sp. 21615526]|uniref:CPBP family intramembrane glutamic endopeptidase n=1 Tax=Pseudomonas TaxID=286 RepID=UPI000281C598|nr:MULTISPECIES: CPBP family intramembrane glutamic endopeptidase [Pseudomonas]MBT1265175.1 CPBP family intramembrane metalloprotease [Pseudomonas sp. VS38]NVZ33617.1 CPBP family intramembrane metalloprotease [Pseudomonas sp. A4002]NVZ37100.1 CPBP family intramembrane metalloprotease [Pseudomonas sp. 21615526]NWA35709.1 CPBP family intramembrane metalloprotease [Pseudomonas sp. C6002]NWB24734.1 CPBP family intramembrane metalloprotease [Pseudomonas sp. D4002]NWB62737.1 CPBP family intramembra
MIAEAFAVLVHYGIYLLPGLILFGLWFGLTPKTLPGLRIVILLLAFVLMRDAMTPLGMWSLSREVQIEFTANPWVLAALGGLSLGLIALLARLAPELWQLTVLFKGNRWAGLAVGLGAGCLIGLPLRLYQGIEPVYWAWLMGMLVLAYCANALEEVLFRGFLQGYLEQHVTPLRAALLSGLAFAACHSFLALSVTQLGWPVLAFTLIEGVACGLVRMRYGVVAATATHGTAILLIAVPMV